MPHFGSYSRKVIGITFSMAGELVKSTVDARRAEHRRSVTAHRLTLWPIYFLSIGADAFRAVLIVDLRCYRSEGSPLEPLASIRYETAPLPLLRRIPRRTW